MNSNDEGSRSGQSKLHLLFTRSSQTHNNTPANATTTTASPSMPATPATSNQLRRSPSQETVMTTITEASTQSLNYPGPPRNTRATTSEAGDTASTASPLETGLETLTQRLSMSRTPPSTPPFGAHGRDDSSSTLTSLKEEEGKYPTGTASATSSSGPSTPRAPPPPRQTKMTNKKRPAESSSSPKTFEYSVWAMVAEEDTIAALKRMAMLAKDEHAHDPSKSVEKHYSARLAKLIKQAELGFDAAELEK